MRVYFVNGYKFPSEVRKAIRLIAKRSQDAFLEIMGGYPFIEVIHAMDDDEIRKDSMGDGGAGYMEIIGNRIKIAIAPNLTPYRSAEVWVEEQAHAIDPSLSENVVRNHIVPAIMKRALARS